jgi:hypothetical protein
LANFSIFCPSWNIWKIIRITLRITIHRLAHVVTAPPQLRQRLSFGCFQGGLVRRAMINAK